MLQGHPNPRFLPVQNVNDAFTAAMTQGESSTSLLKYGRSQGNVPMCEAVCELLRSKAKRKKVSPAEILITNGSGPGLSLVCHLFAKESDVRLAFSFGNPVSFAGG